MPVLLLALEEPDIARSLIVGDFAPFNRPTYMSENLRALKSKPDSDRIRAFMNANREEILANIFCRGLPKEAHYEVSREFRNDMARGWGHGEMTSVDTFYHYYSHFTRDQEYLESNLAKLATAATVVWDSEDLYIKKEMGIEFADRIGPRRASSFFPASGTIRISRPRAKPLTRSAPHSAECPPRSCVVLGAPGGLHCRLTSMGHPMWGRTHG